MQVEQSSKDSTLLAQTQFRVGKKEDNELHKSISVYQWEIASTILKRKPELASQRGTLGEFPLHMALKRGAPEQFLLDLMDVFGEATHMTGLDDRTLPLHIATIHSLSAKIIIALIRIYPDALDYTDEDGDTPRNCVRRNLDKHAKEAIMKPTFYWTELLNKFREEAAKSVGRELGAKINSLEETLEDERNESKQKILDLEKKLKELEAKESSKAKEVGTAH